MRVGTLKTGLHRWGRYRALPWPVCMLCGLVWLRNAVSNRAARGPCKWWD